MSATAQRAQHHPVVECSPDIFERLKFGGIPRVEGIPIISARMLEDNTLMLVTGLKYGSGWFSGRYIPMFVKRYSHFPLVFEEVRNETRKGSVVIMDLRVTKTFDRKYPFSINVIPEEAEAEIVGTRPKHPPQLLQRTLDTVNPL